MKALSFNTALAAIVGLLAACTETQVDPTAVYVEAKSDDANNQSYAAFSQYPDYACGKKLADKQNDAIADCQDFVLGVALYADLTFPATVAFTEEVLADCEYPSPRSSIMLCYFEAGAAGAIEYSYGYGEGRY